ncbi:MULTISPECIES: HNH endonuclease signature motif containing protein [Pseudomonas]|uniref:HNH endonuclease signature motif containing protein n=1 Tax=Pseudomonas TaxID=286 RepID=UPI00259AE46C|nr:MULTISPECIES: HNH endonuclease signature motif containing protein [Pseudomonas]
MSKPSFPLRNEMDRQRAIALLQECFEITNDELIWKQRPAHHFSTQRACSIFNSKYSGKKAGTKDSKGYLQVKVSGTLLLAHRVIWLLSTGGWPGSLDHIDGNPLNNALSNLREVSHQQNMRNQKRRSDNRSGLMGVHWLPAKGQWIAKIQNRHIGTFSSFLDACAARKSAELNLNFHFNHGRLM